MVSDFAEVREYRTRLIVTVSNGWTVRNVIHSGFAESLSADFEVVLVATPKIADYLRKCVMPSVVVADSVLREVEPIIWRIVRLWRKVWFQGRTQCFVIGAKRRHAANGRWFGFAEKIMWSLLERIARIPHLGQFVDRLNERVEDVICCERRTLRKFRAVGVPTLVLNCCPFSYSDNSFMRGAVKIGARAVSLVPSWDNPTSKGPMPVRGVKILCWGPYQVDEIADLYPWVDESQLRPTGLPNFDILRRAKDSVCSLPLRNGSGREVFVADIEGDNRLMVLYATGSPRNHPDEPEIVFDLISRLQSSDIGNRFHVVIRCHPNDDPSRYERSIQRERVWLQINSPDPRKYREDSSRWSSAWVPNPDDSKELAALLSATAVCVNIASTVIVDALLVGTSVVWLGFTENPNTGLRGFANYNHLRPVVESAAIPCAMSLDELASEVVRLAMAPSEKVEQRRLLLGRLVHLPKATHAAAIREALVEEVNSQD